MKRLKIAICHCKTRIIDEILSKIQTPIEPLIFKNWQEEDLYLKSPDCDLYLASPDVAYSLIKKGYMVASTTSEERLSLLKLPGESLPEEPRIAISGRKNILATLFFTEPDLFKSELIFTTCPEAEHKLKEGIVDAIIIPEAIAQRISTRTELIRNIPCILPHILMVKPSTVERIPEDIKEAFTLKPASPDLTYQIELHYKQTTFLEEYHKNRHITEHILDFPDTFVAIYRDTFLFMNECAQKLTGYTEEEFKQLPVLEIVADELKPEISEIIRKRLRGEKLKRAYRYLKLKAKDGNHFYLLAAADTIVYQGEFAGLVFGVNVTKYVRLEKIRELIRAINNASIKSKNHQELFKLVCDNVVKHLDISLAWIGIKDNNGKISVACKSNREIEVPFDPSEPVYKALSEGKVVINSNTKIQPESPWKEKLLKLNFMSSAYIPISKWGRTIGVLCIYSSEPFYFEEEHRELLEDLKMDLSIGTERLALQRELQIISEAVERTKEVIIISDPDGSIIYANPQAQDMLGLKETKNKSIFEILSLSKVPATKEHFHTYCAVRSPTGKLIHLEVDCYHITLSDGSPKILITAKDVTKEALLSREIDKLKYTDPITELPNTNAFSINVNRKLKEIEGKAAMMVLHLRGLPQINFNFGFKAGDALLKEAAHRLTKSLMKKDLIARLDGSKFGILVTDIKDQHDLFKIIKRIIDAMELPFSYRGDTLHLIPSIGISVYPDDGEDFYTLYKNALAALHIAKGKLLARVEFFNKDMKQIMEHFTSASQLVKEAVEKELFVFYYQPYFRADDLSLAGFEALVRIVDENGTIHHPAEFIDYLENSIYNNQFQRWAIEKAVEKIRDWNTSISINISGRSFLEDDFLETINTVPDDVADKMVVEITERIMLKDINRSKKIMQKMKPKIKIAIDDFGTGYSSLLYLRELPADILKIDMQFIKEITKGKRELGIVKIIVDMAHTLGMEAVAEGVETKRHLELLREIKCDYLQGFYLARPMPEEEAERLIRK